MSGRFPTEEELWARADEIAAQAPPLTPEQISKIRMIFGFDPMPLPAPMRTAGSTNPAAATSTHQIDPHEVFHERTPGDQPTAA